jgi:hypothetical protein
MEPEGSLPFSQEPATCPYPEPNESNPHPQTGPYTADKNTRHILYDVIDPQRSDWNTHFLEMSFSEKCALPSVH